MLGRVVRIVQQVVPAEHIVCVAARGQSLPQLPAPVRLTYDPIAAGGPLVGLAAGIDALPPSAGAAYVTGCDMPLILTAFVDRMFDSLDDAQIAAPHDGPHWHPLAAVYRTDVRATVESLLAAGSSSLIALLEAARTRRLPVDELRDVDPQLLSLVSCNTIDEYHAALRLAGLTAAHTP